MQQLVISLLLDDGGQGLARALAGLAVGLVLALFVAVLVPLALLTEAGVLHVAPTTGRLDAPVASASAAAIDALAPAPAVATSHAIELARRYLGVRYVFGGTDPAIGLDCSGLVRLVFRQLGVSLPRTAQLQYEATAHLPQDQLQPGDLVFFARTYPEA